jgi:hypothetical protein
MHPPIKGKETHMCNKENEPETNEDRPKIHVLATIMIFLAFIGFLAVLSNVCCGCAYAPTSEAPEPPGDITINKEPGDTTDEYLRSDECTFTLYVDAVIDSKRTYLRELNHRLTVQYDGKRVSIMEAWPLSSVTVPCRACFAKTVRGYIEYVDDAGLAFQWACWSSTPPLDITFARAMYKTRQHVYSPRLMPAKDLCANVEEPTTFDVKEACKVLPYDFKE